MYNRTRLLPAAILASALAAVLTLGACTQESANRVVSIETPGAAIDAKHLQRIDAILQADVDAGLRAGFVAAVVTREGVAYKTAIGKADPFTDVDMTTDTRFRIASMTKPVVSVAVMQLVDKGVIRLNDPVEQFIPAYANPQVATDKTRKADGSFETRPAARSITIHDLLTHQAGIGYVFSRATDLDSAYVEANLFVTEGSLEDRINLIAAIPLQSDPGEVWSYSFSTDILGRVIEAASGQPLGDYLQEYIFTPLSMNNTGFFMEDDELETLATVVEFDEKGEMFVSRGNDSSPGINEQPFGVMAGGAGLLSSVDDYARFMRMLLNGGALDGARILSPATVDLMMSDHTPFDARPEAWRETGMTFGLGGYVIEKPGYMKNYAAKGDWGWAGYWDTYFFVNPKENIGTILLAQTQPGPHMPPSRTNDLVKAIAYGAQTE